MTDDEGRYIAGLDPDTYDVIAEATGFKAGYRKSIPIARDARSYVDFVLSEESFAQPLIGAQPSSFILKTKESAHLSPLPKRS